MEEASRVKGEIEAFGEDELLQVLHFPVRIDVGNKPLVVGH